MASRLNPYISFTGTARQALDFYQGVFGGEVTVSTFGDFPGADDSFKDQVMHGQLETPAGYTLMVSDTPPMMKQITVGDNITVSLSGDDAEELRGYFDGLCDGGTVTTKLEKQMWGDEFGACVDRFGINWLVNIAGSAA